MKHECEHRVRSYECDANGHVNNAVYLNYLEYARHEHLRAVGFDYTTLVAAGYGIYVARIEIEYKRPAFLYELLAIHTWPIKKGAVSGVMAQEVYHNGTLLVQAKVTWAFVDSKGAPTKIPKEWDLPGLKP